VLDNENGQLPFNDLIINNKMPGKKPTYSQLEKRILELENKLQKKEEKFRWLFQQSPEAITILSLDGVILDFNHEYAFTGYHRDEMIGKHFTELASFKEEEERFRSIVNGNTEPFNIKVVTKDGDTLWGEVHPAIFGNKDEKFVRLLVRDVTDELKQEERYENILKTAIDGYWLVNQDGSVLDANQAAANMLGYSLKELSGLNVSDIEAKETAEETKIHIAEIKKQGSGFFETKHRKKDGSIIDIEVSVSFLSTFEGHFVAVIRDITEKKQMQKRLLRKKELLDKSQSMAKLGSWELELEENTLYWSDEVYRIFGIQPQQFKATYEAFLDRVHPDDRKAVSKAYEESLEKNQDQYEIEHRIIRKDSGEIRYVHEKCIHYKDDSGKIFKSVGMVQDITDRKRNESEREITLRLLKHLNTNEGLHELLSGVVQAIKNWSGFEAVGIRIKEGEDYPYFESSGFPADFVEKENTLCEEDKNGKYVRDTQGNPVLECMCGNVLSGRYDSSLPFFTENGSFWTNSTTELLASTSDEDRKTRTRNRCNGEGYESVSLIPLKHGNQTVGLIQINDSRKNLLDEEMVSLFERLASKIALSLVHQYTADELNQSEKKYRTIVDESPIGILYFNKRGEITDCNKKFVEVIGSSKEALINLNMFTQLENEKIIDAVKDALETGEGYYEDWYFSVTANKKAFVRILFEGIRNEKDEIVAGLGMVEDITERKQAEKKLVDSEARYRLLFDHSPMLISVVDKEGVCQFANKKTAAMFGVKPEEMVGKKFDDFHPDQATDYRSRVRETINSGETRDYEDIVKFPTGTHWIYSRVQPIPDLKGNYKTAQVISYDITERKRAQEKLISSEKKYRNLFENAPVGIFQTNAKGKPLLVNSTMAKILDFEKPEEAITSYDNLGEQLYANPDRRKEFLEQIKKNGYVEDFEYEARTVKGRKIWLSMNARIVKKSGGNNFVMEGFASDITARKRAETELQKQEAKQRAMIANISDVLAIMDEQGIIRYKSPNIEKLFGWKPEELIGKLGWETVHPEDQKWLKKVFSNLLKEKNATTKVEYRYKCKNGKYLPVLLTAVNLLDNPAINGVLLNYHDISERKNREHQIKLNEERLDALVELNEMIYDNLDDVYNFTLEKAIRLTKSEIGFLGFLNDDESVITIYDWSETAKDDCEIKDDKIKFKVEEAGIWGEVVRQRKPFIINNFKTPNPLKRGLPEGHVGISNYLSVPVFQGNKIVSLIAVGNKKEDYHQDDLKQLKLLLDGMMKFVIKRESEREIISAKQKAEESEERYQNFLKHSSEGIYRLEMDEPMDTSLGEEEQIDFLYDNAYIAECNEAFVKMYGAASIDNFIGMRLIDMHEGRNHPINRQEVREFVREDYRIEDKQTKEKKVTGEVLYLSNNTIGIEEDGKIVRMWGTQTDITQRKIMQNQLILAKEKSENEESKAKSVLKAIPDLMFLFSHEGNILDYHAEDNSMLYRPPEDFLNKKIDEVLPGYLVTLTHKKIDEVLKTGEMREYDYKMDINQQVFYFEARMVKVANDKALTIVRDVTESRKNKQELVKAKVKAEESDRLKSAFLANMSHEIRTPMNAIMGFSQMLYEKEFPRNRQKKFLDLINTRTKDLLQIINDIVDISKIEANQLTVNFERFNLNDLLHQIYETYRLQNKEAKKQDLHFELKNGLARDKSYLYSDYHRLNQVLENLLSNAFKYTSKGSIALGYEQQSANILQFYVKDTGIGIDPEDQKSIFERFRQVDGSSSRAYEGTGLGLAITKSLVELLGGEIRVDSKPGEGAVFYFTIPYQDAPGEENIDETKIAEGNYNWKGKTILLVEDDPASYEYMKEVIEPAGARLIIKETGKEGLKALADIKTPDLILMDIRLPDISGLEIIRQIRKTNKEIPIIAQTAHAMGEDRQTCLKAGASDYLSKPVALKDLMAIIDRYL